MIIPEAMIRFIQTSASYHLVGMPIKSQSH